MAWTKPFMQTNIPKVTGGGRTMSDTTRHIEETRRWYPHRFETGENDNEDVCQAFDELFAALDAERARAERLAGALEGYIKADVSDILELAHYYAPGELGEAQDRMEREILAYLNARIVGVQVLPGAVKALDGE